MIIKQATIHEQSWVDEQYKKVNFLPSDVEVDYVAIAHLDGQKTGLGRLVPIEADSWEMGGMFVLPEFRKKGIAGKIVSHLVEKHDKQLALWCIPFLPLVDFYARFGFVEIDPKETTVPKKILDKHNWCDVQFEAGVAFMLLKL